MNVEKIVDRMALLEAHLKNTKEISKGMRDMIMSNITQARLNIDDEEILNMFWNTIRGQNKLLKEHACTFGSGVSQDITAPNEATQQQIDTARPLLIESFQLVDPLFFRGRGGRVFENGEDFADFVLNPNIKRLNAELDAKVWDGNYPITLAVVEEPASDEEEGVEG